MKVTPLASPPPTGETSVGATGTPTTPDPPPPAATTVDKLATVLLTDEIDVLSDVVDVDKLLKLVDRLVAVLFVTDKPVDKLVTAVDVLVDKLLTALPVVDTTVDRLVTVLFVVDKPLDKLTISDGSAPSPGGPGGPIAPIGKVTTTGGGCTTDTTTAGCKTTVTTSVIVYP